MDAWKLKEEAMDNIPWRTRFGRGYGPVAILINSAKTDS
jgi:hypothetical protein